MDTLHCDGWQRLQRRGLSSWLQVALQVHKHHGGLLLGLGLCRWRTHTNAPAGPQLGSGGCAERETSQLTRGRPCRYCSTGLAGSRRCPSSIRICSSVGVPGGRSWASAAWRAATLQHSSHACTVVFLARTDVSRVWHRCGHAQEVAHWSEATTGALAGAFLGCRLGSACS